MNDRSAPDARDAGAQRQLLRSARKHGAALASETVSPVDLPPVRLGLLTKIQVLAVALVFVTAVAITGYMFWREWSGGEDELRAQALTLSTMLAEVVDEPLAAPLAAAPAAAQVRIGPARRAGRSTRRSSR